MNIRKFSESDRCALQEVYLESRIRYFTWLDASTFLLTDFDHDTKGEIIWTAIYNNRPIGFISVWEPENFIHNLFIAPDYIGHGIGSKLLNECLSKIGKPATLKCSKPNIKARSFYLSKGWQVVSEGEGPDGEYELMSIDKEI